MSRIDRSKLSPEELRAHKAAIKRRCYHKHKGDPGVREALNEANLARYHAKKGDSSFMDALNAKRRERYDKRKNDPEYVKHLSEKFRRTAMRRMWDGIVRGAIKRSIAKNLPYDPDLLEWAPTVWTGRCALSGIEFRRNVGLGPGPFSPSIDRIRPELGYTKGNCRFILHAINAMKGSGSDEEMLLIARALVSRAALGVDLDVVGSLDEQAGALA
jgi:hypothetical protein